MALRVLLTKTRKRDKMQHPAREVGGCSQGGVFVYAKEVNPIVGKGAVCPCPRWG